MGRLLLLFVILLNWPNGATSDCASDLGRWEKKAIVANECAASFFPNEIWDSAVDMYKFNYVVNDTLAYPLFGPHKLVNDTRTSVPSIIALNFRMSYTQNLYTLALDAVQVMNQTNAANLAAVERFPWAFEAGTGAHTTFEQYTYEIIDKIYKKCGS